MSDEIFSSIYKNEMWSSEGLGSGSGSSLKLTTTTRLILEDFIKKQGIKSMIDASCGKMNWMPLVLQNFDTNINYLGLDVVEDVIKYVRFKHQNQLFSKIRYEFKQFDITREIVPSGYDLIHCRDTLQHLSYSMIVSALENFSRSEFRFILIGSYNNNHENRNILIGDCFSINLLDPPFSLPLPQEILSEKTKLYSDEPEKFYLVYNQEVYKSIDFVRIKQVALAI